jgi:hypothetical protein
MLTAQSFRQLPLKEQLQKTEFDFSNWELWTKDNLKITNEDLSGNIKKNKLKELSKLLKDWDYTYVYSDERNAYKKGVAQEKEIQKLYKEIGAEGLKMYRDFLKSKGMMEGQNGRGIFDYERYYHSKMKKWGIKDIDELSPEDKRKFDAEVDRDWKNNSDVKVNMPEDKSEFPEMQNVEGRGTLDYAIRHVGDKSLTASTFGDSGNLYPEHLTPKFIPPSKERMRHMK